MADGAPTVQAFGRPWYVGLTPLAQRTVDAWLTSKGLRLGNTKEIRVVDGEPGCVVVAYVERDGKRELTLDGKAVAQEARQVRRPPGGAPVTWFGWVLVGIQVFGALAYVAQIGKPSEPRTPRGAVIFLVVSGAVAAGVLTIGTGRGL